MENINKLRDLQISVQKKRIQLLEEKLTVLRKNYFQLKYAGLFLNLNQGQ